MTRPVSEPYAITMWDFSWLERRWPGAGYEDWDRVLDELAERGYNAVRIDAYPHLVSAGAEDVWELLPQWTENTWGAQSVTNVRVLPELIEFISKAKDRNIGVALSTWFRQDRSDTRMRINTPQALAQVWIDTLEHLDRASLLDNILYVDLCNEFPLPNWAPFLYGIASGAGYRRTDAKMAAWMSQSIEAVRNRYPDLDYTFSFAGQYDDWPAQDVAALDFLEPHIWMALPEVSDYYVKVGYNFEQYSPVGYDNIAARGRSVYLADQERYDHLLFSTIDELARWSFATGKPLVTTECWSVVDYKDWPGLDWDWVMDLNARAVEYAVGTGRWIGIATSNFTGPQFRGVWRDVDWHQRLTSLIRSAPIAADLTTNPSA